MYHFKIITMSIKLFVSCLLLIHIFSAAIAQEVRIPDANFKKSLIAQGIDINGDGKIQLSEAKSVKVLYVNKAGITSLDGIKNFSNVEDLGFYENDIKEVDLSGMTSLKFIYGFDTHLESMNIKGCTNVLNISCHKNNLQELDVSDQKKLVELSLGFNQLTRLDITGLTALKKVHAYLNQIQEFKFDSCPQLEEIWINENRISHHLDLTKFPNLKFFIAFKNPIQSVNIVGLEYLEDFSCHGSSIKTLNLSGTKRLKEISWY
jgi:Leucine-rich repeat (LRR) protein